ncbi:hypothetical protein M231_07732, partial [Tremella mesenterica]
MGSSVLNQSRSLWTVRTSPPDEKRSQQREYVVEHPTEFGVFMFDVQSDQRWEKAVHRLSTHKPEEGIIGYVLSVESNCNEPPYTHTEEYCVFSQWKKGKWTVRLTRERPKTMKPVCDTIHCSRYKSSTSELPVETTALLDKGGRPLTYSAMRFRGNTPTTRPWVEWKLPKTNFISTLRNFCLCTSELQISMDQDPDDINTLAEFEVDVTSVKQDRSAYSCTEMRKQPFAQSEDTLVEKHEVRKYDCHELRRDTSITPPTMTLLW